jgi:Ser/Thr protein kinase RdoA (MazF antagonist)
MRPFEDLTYSGRLRRFRKLARTALDAYGLSDARLKFISYHGNVIYRVDARRQKQPASQDRRYAPGRYVLRIHMDYHSAAAIRSELRWLIALRHDADLAVPEPVPTLDGELCIEPEIPATLGRRKCSLLRWLNGRFLKKTFRPVRARAWGRLMARLHEHAVTWQRPGDFTRRHNDWDGLFGDGARFEFPASRLWEAIPVRFREPFENVTRGVRRVMNDLGRGSDVYGLVHADLDVKTNVLFGDGEARVIDFDDSGFAYWLHDLAFALSPWQGSKDWCWVQDSLLEGYSAVRPFPESQLKHLDLFMAAYNATLMLWMIDWALLCPQATEPGRYVNKYGDSLLRHFAGH